MKVIILNGSPHPAGNTARAIEEMIRVFREEEVETELIQVGSHPVPGCCGCNRCMKRGRCVMEDLVNETADKVRLAHGLVLASPVYYGSANGSFSAFLDRLFYSMCFGARSDLRFVVGASISVARRAGGTSTFDQLNKYFTVSGMPIAGSQYWNMAYGTVPGDVEGDPEGLQTMRTLARNMSFLMKSVTIGKALLGAPKKEAPVFTNFVNPGDVPGK